MAIPDPATTEWVPIWNPTSEGPVGPPGPPGDTTPYRDLVEGTYANPAADVARVYALDVNGYTQVEMKDSAGRGVRFSSDNVIIAKITEPAGVARGQAVYIAGASGANSLVRLARADTIATMPAIGIVLDAGAVNAFTRILSVGTLQGVDTSAFVEGVSLFVSPTVAGGFTATLPLAPNYAQRVGFVTRSHATQGEILVLTTGVLADPRLHHTTHETGGTDAITALSGSVITTGTVADARLSANVALKNIDNQFSSGQSIIRPFPVLNFTESSFPADARTVRVFVGGSGPSTGNLYFQAINDASTISQGVVNFSRNGSISCDGSITERARTVAMGEWINIPFNAADFTTPTAGATFVVSSVATFAYSLVGKTVHLALMISATGAITGNPVRLYVTLPAAIRTAAHEHSTTYSYYSPGTGPGTGVASLGTSGGPLDILRDIAGTTFLPGNQFLWISMTYSIV